MRASRLPRICYVIPSLGIGGTERQLIELMREIVRDYELTVVCTHREGGLAGDARRLGAYVHCLQCRSGWDPRLKSRLRRIFRRHRPDVVHTYLFGFDYAANVAAADLGVPVIVSSRRQLATWKKRRHIVLQRKANRFVDCIVANSQAVADFACAQEDGDPALFHVIPNGVRVEEFTRKVDIGVVRTRYGVPRDARVVGMVANFAPIKDHALFVAMAEKLAERIPDIHFLLVGRGPEQAHVDRTIDAAGLKERFSIVAALAELSDLYAIMDVKVLTSHAEGFPNVILEAMASGTPVVAAAVGGIVEAVADGLTGSLITSREPEDFAEAVARLLDQPEKAAAMGLAGQARVQARYSVGAMAVAHRKLYDTLLESRGH